MPKPPASAAASIELITSPSASRLIDEMMRRVGELSRSGEAIALVAPTTRLLDACRSALLQAARPAGAMVGVHLLHHRSLATHVLARAFLHGARERPAPRLLSALEMEALARAAVGSLPPASELRRLCEDRPRFVASLQRTLGELREALVSPAMLGKELGKKDDLTLLHAAHDALLDRFQLDGNATDPAGHALEAVAAARALANGPGLPWTHLVHHGSHELIGAQAALVEAVASALPTIVLAPSGAGPAHVTARRGLARFPGARASEQALDAPHAAPTLLDTDALCDEEADAERGTLRLPDAPVLDAFHVRGMRAEMSLAARLCAEAHLKRGVPLEEIGVVARSLEPFAPHLETAFREQGVPFTTSATAPLLREPWARAAATLFDVLADGLPRPATAELLRSPWTALRDKANPADITPDLWDEWTMKARVVSGAGSLTEDVIAWHESDLADHAQRNDLAADALATSPRAALRRRRLAALSQVVAQLERDRIAWTRCRTHAQHAQALREILARWLRPPEERSGAFRARDTVMSLLDDLARLDGLPLPEAGKKAAKPSPPDVDRVRKLLAESLATASLPVGVTDGSGVRVLGAMPARGVPFREIVLMGFTQGSFPRRPRHDPFLNDAVRERLRAAAPAVGVKHEARDEERQLLALLLGAATSRIHVTWQRADDDGGVRAPSLFLREIARLTLGRPSLDVMTRTALSVPGHPALASEVLRERFGRATFRDAMLEASERPQRRRAIEAVARRAGRLDEGLTAGLRSVALLDSFTLESDPQARKDQLAHDGMLGPGVVPMPERISASALQTFGRCGLQWLFSRGFGIPQREDEPDPLGVGADEMGTCVHAVLEAVNRHAIERGGDPEHLVTKQARLLLRTSWLRGIEALAGARRARAPLAWDVLEQLWLDTLERFVERDAERLGSEGARIVAAEGELSHAVEIRRDGKPVTLPLRGRVDRIIELPWGWQVEDYKTSPRAGSHVERARVLKGLSLQGLAYLLLLREWAKERTHSQAVAPSARAAFLSVHPAAESHEPHVLDVNAFEESWSETLAVIEATWRGGAFGLRKGGCDWCDFRAACRRDHAPTRVRSALVEEWSDYMLSARKSTRKDALRLADIRSRAKADTGPGDGEDA